MATVHRLIPRNARNRPEPILFVLVVEEENGAMEFTGPFASEVEAMNFAEVTQIGMAGHSWWVTELFNPHEITDLRDRSELLSRGWREVPPNGVLKEFPTDGPDDDRR